MTMHQSRCTLSPFPRGYHIITEEVVAQTDALGDYEVGLLHLHLLHTSAALTLNENTDPEVRADFRSVIDRLLPDGMSGLRHTLEGDDDMVAHIKSSLIGPSLTIPVRHGQLQLGMWQGIYLCEFRNRGGARSMIATLTGHTTYPDV